MEKLTIVGNQALLMLASSALEGRSIMYTIYLDLDDVWTAATTTETHTVHVQHSIRVTGTTIPVIESDVLLTIPVPQDNMLAARIVTERADALVDRRLLYEAIAVRVSRIVEILATEAEAAGLVVRPGIALVPGLLDDLKQTECATGKRWQISEAERGDPRTRTLSIKK